MTILQASIDLFNWFKENDSFSIDNKNDLKKLNINNTEDVVCFSIALERLEKIELVQSADLNGSRIYVMEKSMGNFEQVVSIPGSVASSVAKTVNDFCAFIDDDTDLCDPVAISAKDIMNLTLIVQFYIKESSPKAPQIVAVGDDSDENPFKKN